MEHHQMDIEVVTRYDVHVYKTLSGFWRAYVRESPGLQAWGFDEKRALVELGKVLAEKDIPFDLSDDDW